jgi:hypothetical protein
MRQPAVGDPNVFRAFTSFGADIDLTAQSGAPKAPAVRLEVHNDQVTTQDIVIRGPDGTNVTFEIPADSVRVIRSAVSAIESTGTETIASVNAYWVDDGTSALNA